MTTVQSIINAKASTRADSTFLISPETNYELSYSGLQQAAQNIGKYLPALGLAKGDKAAFLMSNGLWSVKIFLGTMYSGRVIVPLNAVCGDDQLRYVIEHCDARVIFVEEDYRQKYSAVFADLPPQIQIIPTCRDNGPQWPVTLEAAEQMEAPVLTQEDEALLIYTSGTTGRPKGVVLTHRAVIAGGNNTAAAHQLHTGDRALCVLQLYHINGEMVTVMGPLVSGGSVVMPPAIWMTWSREITLPSAAITVSGT